MKKLYLYPLWLRFWHWLNALLFLVLIISGISLHYSESGSLIVPFRVAMLSHNIAGVLLSLIYIFYIASSIISGNIWYYKPIFKGLLKRLVKQIKFYLMGIFNRDAHPFYADENHKFNPLQQLSYIVVIFVFIPLIIISGWLMLFPEYAPDEIFGMGGIWPMAILHIIVGFILSLFMFVHIYLGTTGETIGDLFKSMLTGWHLSEEEKELQPVMEPIRTDIGKKRLFPIVFYNPITMTGVLVAAISLVTIVFLMVLEFFSTEVQNPYIGIVTFIILPSFLIGGLILIAFGAIRENRRLLRLKEGRKALPIIDLNNPRYQIATLVFTTGTFLLILLSAFGSFKAYEYTDSDEFCGTVCHKLMHPEYTAYKQSPHSRVACVKCHIGPGASWFVRSKLSGVYQVYATLFNKYDRPIPTPVDNLRPAEETCEQCHWPKAFYSDKKIDYYLYKSDENNSLTKATMLVFVGGGNSITGNRSGIHYNMNIANEITYIPTDREREVIPWVKVKNLATGKETLYQSIDNKLPDKYVKPENMRKFDCIDCHNRPTHIYNQPNSIVNTYMSVDLISATLPYIKTLAVQALETYATNRNTAYQDISNYIWNFYKQNYADTAYTRKKDIEKSISAIHTIYMNNYFPDMKVSWRSHPDNIGHLYSKGCFRCHDGKHVSNDGKVLSKNCNLCHIIIEQQGPDQTKEESYEGLKFLHPGGIEKMVNKNYCPDCHSAQGITHSGKR
jgi:thiosulfate reductase cytochrome b subunit